MLGPGLPRPWELQAPRALGSTVHTVGAGEEMGLL